MLNYDGRSSAVSQWGSQASGFETLGEQVSAGGIGANDRVVELDNYWTWHDPVKRALEKVLY